MAKSTKSAGKKEPSTQGRARRELGAKWIRRIDAAGKKEKSWLDDAAKATKAYTGESKGEDGSTLSGVAYDFNILFSNVETIVPAIINSPPSPDIRRRFGDDDPAAKDVAEIIERAIRVQVDDSKLQVELEAQAQDIFLAGRGVVRLRFKSDFIKDKPDDEELQAVSENPPAEDDPDAEGEADLAGAVGGQGGDPLLAEPAAAERLANERIEFEVVSWRDYRHGPAKRWQDRPWDAFRFVVSRDDEDDLFDGGLISDQVSDDERKQRNEADTDLCGWEIWDKRDRKVTFVDDEGVILKVVDDPLGLQNFFCIATPAQAVEVTGRLMPVNPFAIYQKLADELDITTKRIAIITDEMKVRGWYSGDAADMQRILEAADNEFVPISNAEVWAAHGGLQGAVAFWPIEKFIVVLQQLYAGREQTKQAIYEITGISDIVRGASRANETLGAQQIKTQWGSLRIQKMQRMIERTARDLFVMMGEIIPAKFSIETLEAMTGIQIAPKQEDMVPVQPPAQAGGSPEEQQAAMAQVQQAEKERQEKVAKLEAVQALLQRPLSRMYQIDVESDSTVKADLTRQKAEMSEFLAGAGTYFAAVGPLVKDGTLPKDAAAEIFVASARLFNLGKSVEDTLERLTTEARAAAEQPPQPDPEQVAAQQEAQAKQADREQERQFKAEEHQQRMAEIKAQSDSRRQETRARENQALMQAGLPPLPDAEAIPAEAILQALQAQQQQIQQLITLFVQTVTAPKTITLSDGRTLQIGTANGQAYTAERVQ